MITEEQLATAIGEARILRDVASAMELVKHNVIDLVAVAYTGLPGTIDHEGTIVDAVVDQIQAYIADDIATRKRRIVEALDLELLPCMLIRLAPTGTRG